LAISGGYNNAQEEYAMRRITLRLTLTIAPVLSITFTLTLSITLILAVYAVHAECVNASHTASRVYRQCPPDWVVSMEYLSTVITTVTIQF